ncbi:MAG: cobaltochelatase subunit CobN [Acidaminococcaceae bacterium]|nr:cobaltochelatase subunit CobN [Acidaminococcaceae bacterium]
MQNQILIFTNVERQCQRLNQAANLLKEENKIQSACVSVFFNSESTFSNAVQNLLDSASVIFFLWQGAVYPTPFSDACRDYLQKKQKRFIMGSSTMPEIEAVCDVGANVLAQVSQYIFYSGTENYKNLWLYLCHEFFGEEVSYYPPAALPWMGTCDLSERKIIDSEQKVIIGAVSDSCHQTVSESAEGKCNLQDRDPRPLIGILFARENWIWQEVAYLKELVNALEGQGLRTIPVYCLWCDNEAEQAPGLSRAVKKYFYKDGKCIVDAVVNTFKISLTLSSQNDKNFMKDLNVPVLQGYNLLRDYDSWWDSYTGMVPVELSCNVIQPEMDGVIHIGPVSYKDVDREGIAWYAPLHERIEAFARKVKKWAILSHLQNKDKRVAIIFHNYPPTNDSIGSAQGLDSPASVALLLKAMKEAGYRMDFLPEDGKELIDKITEGFTNDRRFLTESQIAKAAGKVSKEEYREWFGKQDAAVQEEMTRDWGEAPGDVFCHEGALLMPGICNGNIFIGMQPPRGFGDDPGKIIHNPACPPPHHYLAYYKWLRDTWKADAVIHVGTHGSLEWLPGKNAGLSGKCYPDVALGDLPDIYPYYVTIVGEGIQAKRRGSACLIGHLNPPTGRADVYEDLAELEKLLDEYAQLKVQQPGSENVVQEKILCKITDMHLEEELPKENLSDDEYILKVHTYVEKLKHMQIRTGLHIFGCPPEGEELREFLLVLTRVEDGDVHSLPKVICSAFGQDYYELEEKSGELLADGETGAQLLDKVWDICTKIVEFLMEKGLNANAVELLLASEPLRGLNLSKESALDLETVVRFMVDTLAPNLAKTKQEITNTLRALDGEFIEPGPGGAPTSGRADILPTGRNFYGVDPYNIPTPVAWEIGKLLAHQAVNRFIKEEGHYPESIGMVIWSDSNMRSNGQDIAEFFYLMGVRPVWQRGSLKVKDLEVIPLQDLKRPRIDVTARISGLFRDTMPAVVELMEAAVNLVKGLDETWEENYIKKHVEQDAAELEQEGADKETAFEQASCRIFGCPPGGYGAGVAHMIEAKNWETVHDLADVYVRWGAHVYGKKMQGQYLPQLFRKRLSTIEITIKNTDNHEVHLLNSDDFNAYCGGMNAAVHSIRGKMPRCYIGDSADRSKAETRSLGEEIRRVFRGESMNPKYIEGMKKHGYKGASDLANLVAHAYGWDCTSEVLEDWMYEGFAKKLALDPEIREWMNEVNPWALHRVAEKLLEAEQRGMWNVLPETKEALRRLYMELEGELEELAEC